MNEPGKETQPRVIRNIGWDHEDWERIEEAARRRGEQEHLDLTPTDIIRAGTRRLVAEILDAKAEAA